MSTQASVNLKHQLAIGAIDFANDSFKIILMDTGFVFNPVTHLEYANVSADELSTGNGYTANTKTLAGVSVTEDTVNNRCSVTWSNVTWTASGGPIGPTPGAIIFDDTVANDPIVGFIDFGGDQTQADGGVATISAIELRIS